MKLLHSAAHVNSLRMLKPPLIVIFCRVSAELIPTQQSSEMTSWLHLFHVGSAAAASLVFCRILLIYGFMQEMGALG